MHLAGHSTEDILKIVRNMKQLVRWNKLKKGQDEAHTSSKTFEALDKRVKDWANKRKLDLNHKLFKIWLHEELDSIQARCRRYFDPDEEQWHQMFNNVTEKDRCSGEWSEEETKWLERQQKLHNAQKLFTEHADLLKNSQLLRNREGV